MKRDLYADVTARIVAELAAGIVPWVKPWSHTPGMNIPQNAVSGRPYSGINVVLFWLARNHNWATPRYLTFNQAKEFGGTVRKGEHGTKVYFFRQIEVADRKNADETKLIPMLREYTVFNVDQCDGLPAKIVVPVSATPRNQDERDATIDEFIAATRATVRENAGEAYYAPGADLINIPAFVAFKGAADYYRILFHELGHWTGHKSRCDRTLKTDNGTQDYALEELVADLCSAFLCAEFAIDGAVRHADYIGTWIDRLKEDPRAFMKAAGKAQKAADYLRGLALADTQQIAA